MPSKRARDGVPSAELEKLEGESSELALSDHQKRRRHLEGHYTVNTREIEESELRMLLNVFYSDTLTNLVDILGDNSRGIAVGVTSEVFPQTWEKLLKTGFTSVEEFNKEVRDVVYEQDWEESIRNRVNQALYDWHREWDGCRFACEGLRNQKERLELVRTWGTGLDHMPASSSRPDVETGMEVQGEQHQQPSNQFIPQHSNQLAPTMESDADERTKSRGKEILRSWLDQHLDNPYPSPAEKQHLQRETGFSNSQLDSWFKYRRKAKKNPNNQTTNYGRSP